MMPIAVANGAHRSRMMQAINSGDVMRSVLETYRARDKDGKEFLTWSNGEIRGFISTAFQQFGLRPPTEAQIHRMYKLFVLEGNTCLDTNACLCLADALFRAVFIID